jgi:small-conductance mechanosensitive channel
MAQIVDIIEKATGLSPVSQLKIFTSILIIIIFLLLRLLLIKILWRSTDDVKIRYRWRKVIGYVVAVLAIVFLVQVWFEGFRNVGTFMGLLTAGLAIALKDLVTNIAGWLFLIIRRPIAVGDRIQIGEVAGDVIDIRLFQFTVLEIGNWVDADQSTGRIIHIPNGKIFTEFQANYTRGFQFIWNEIPVLITFESDWQKAKNILTEVVTGHSQHLTQTAEARIKKAAQKFMIFYNKLTPTVYTSVRDSGVLLTMRYICEPRSRRGSEQVIWEDVLRQFAQSPDIDFAYPTQRFYHNLSEGKQRPAEPTEQSKGEGH